jgi:hypothetical protein
MIAVGFLALVMGAVLPIGSPASAAEEIKTVPVHFKHGKSSATLSGHVTGRETIDYVLGAKAGQEMSVTMKTSNGSNYFNVLPPGSNEEGIFTGSSEGDKFRGTLSKDGDYKIRVYLMRNAARRNEKAEFTLEVAITGGAHAAQAAPAAGAGGFDATGKVPCATAAGQPMGQCDFGVTREGGGTATVTVTMPDGRTRALFFEGGKFTGADVSQADGDLAIKASREADLTLIRVGPERYEVPEAVISGG